MPLHRQQIQNSGKNKFAATVARDKRTEQALKDLGWKVIVLWESEITNKLTSLIENLLLVNESKEEAM